MNNELNKQQIEARLFNLVVFRSLRGELKINEINNVVSVQPVWTKEFQNQKCISSLKYDHFYNKDGMNPLHHMAINYDGDCDINELIMFINLMVYYGFKIDEIDKHGNSPLHYACTNEYSIQLVYSLLKCGSTMLNTNKDYETPLHRAIKSDKWTTVKLLVSWLPHLLLDSTNVKCCLDIIERGKSSNTNLYIFLRALCKFTVWLQSDNHLQYFNIFVLMELVHPYSVILGEKNGNDLVKHAYSFGQEICNLFKVPLS